MTAVVEIPRERAGLVMQALESQAKALRRESMLRGNGGPAMADRRKRLRENATTLDVVAAGIRSDLRAGR